MLSVKEKQRTKTKPEMDYETPRNEPISKIDAYGVRFVYNDKEAREKKIKVIWHWRC